MNNIQRRMQFCAEAVKRLSGKQGIRGQMISAERGARYFSLLTRLANPLQLDAALKLADPLALATHTPVVIAQREAGLIAYQFQLPEVDWQPYTRADLKAGPAIIGVGLAERKRQVNYEFARPHGGFFGATGSGKSVAVDTLLCGLFTAYTPAELRAVVIDPDGDHANFANAANLALPIARSDEEIDYALNYAGTELVRRSNAGQHEVWRLVIVVDEAEETLNGKRLRQAQAIARGGRKWNVNLAIATQDPSEETLPDLLPQIMNRWIGAVASAPVSFYLSGHKGLECHKLTMGGDFMHVTGSQAQRLQVAMPTAADYAALPRAEIVPPEFEPVEVSPERWEVDEGGRGRRPDPLDWRLIGRLLAHLAKSPALADGTLANRLGIGVRKLARHRGIAAEILAGLREEMGPMA